MSLNAVSHATKNLRTLSACAALILLVWVLALAGNLPLEGERTLDSGDRP